MINSFTGHPLERSKAGISLYVKAFRISTDVPSTPLPLIWSVDGESFQGMATLQAEVSARGYPLLGLPPVPRNPIDSAPDFE